MCMITLLCRRAEFFRLALDWMAPGNKRPPPPSSPPLLSSTHIAPQGCKGIDGVLL